MLEKRKSITSPLLLMLVLFATGCISINMPESTLDMNKWDVYNQSFNFTSTYSGAKTVNINLSTNDPRIGVSFDGKKFLQSISTNKEVGKNFTNQVMFYIKVTDQSIPPGDYEILARVTVKDNKYFPNTDKMIVKIGYN